MKKIISLLIAMLLLSSCSIIGGTISAVGTVTGAVIKTTGSIIGSVIGGSDGEIKAKDTKYKFSDVELETDNFRTIVTGTLSHNGSKKINLRIAIPCYDEDGARVGDAIAEIDELKKGKDWDFRAILETGNVASCKMNDTYITSD